VKAIIIKFAAKAGSGSDEVPGWEVPDTEGLFGIDMRLEADLEDIPPSHARWFVTHVPTGMRVHYGDYTILHYRDDAAALAKRFYNEYMQRNWDLRTHVPEAVIAPYKKLTPDEQRGFWEKVAGGWWCKGCQQLHAEKCPPPTSCPDVSFPETK
jgi:hypothetical protein